MGTFVVLVGRRLRSWLLVVLAAVVAVASTLQLASPAQAAAVVSAANVGAVGAQNLQLTESTAIAAETVKAAGTLSGVFSRPIVVQGKSGTGWRTLVESTTSSTGAYTTSFSAPDVGSYAVRVLAPKVAVAGKMEAEYASAAVMLSVVAQSASLSMPTTLGQSETGTATVKFGPVRAGRVVQLQFMQGTTWSTSPKATDVQSSDGTASLTFTAGTPGSYSYRAWTAAANGAPGFASAVAALKVTAAAPGPVTNVAAIPSSTSIGLSWSNPTDPSLSAVTIRRAVGATPPASATAGTLVTDAAKPAESFTDTAVTSGTQYSYALFAHDAAFLFAVAGTVTATTTAGVVPSITGTVTDAGTVRHGLANVRVAVYSPPTDTITNVTTAADGTYAVSGLAAGTDYQVWFYASGATGGAFDALGYLDQAYDNQQPMSGGTPTPVTVTAGASTAAIDAALAVGGAITGTVSEAAGTHHGLADVRVSVSSPSNGNYYGNAKTAADGTYTVQGIPAGTDYQVCFYASGATGGSADATGYLDQCYDNLPNSGTSTPVAVTVGATQAGINAVLAGGGAISGTVRDAGGTGHALARVWVQVSSGTPGHYGGSATTAPDGTYTVSGLSAGTDYSVCFYSAGAIGGSSDALGYVDQCYDGQPTSGTPTPVTVSEGATKTAVDAALGAGTP